MKIKIKTKKIKNMKINKYELRKKCYKKLIEHYKNVNFVLIINTFMKNKLYHLVITLCS